LKRKDTDPSMKKYFKIEVECTLKEEPARIVQGLKRGIVTSIWEAVFHGMLAFHE